MEMCELLTLRHVFDAVWNIQPSPEASSARFYLELWRHRERERERLDNAEACYLYFSFHTASSVYSCSIKEANISLSRSYAHSNHEYCFYTLIVRVIFEAVSSTVIKEITPGCSRGRGACVTPAQVAAKKTRTIVNFWTQSRMVAWYGIGNKSRRKYLKIL